MYVGKLLTAQSLSYLAGTLEGDLPLNDRSVAFFDIDQNDLLFDLRPSAGRSSIGTMDIFERLRKIREFERRRLPHLETRVDFDIVIEIGVGEASRSPLTYKALLARRLGAPATIGRRVRRLRDLGLVIRTPSALDGRAALLTLSRPLLRQLRHYRSFFTDLP